MTVELTVPGEPQAKQRARVVRRKGGWPIAYTPEKTVKAETLIKELFAVHYPAFEPLTGPLSMTVEAFFTMPTSASKKKQAGMEAGEILPTKRPDADNLLKLAADALAGLCFLNDAQICEAKVCKWYSRTPRLQLTIEERAKRC